MATVVATVMTPCVTRNTSAWLPTWYLSWPTAVGQGLQDRGGLPWLRFHDLRGSGATWAAIAGATLPELMHRPGHQARTASLGYKHATSERHREVADRLGALLRPGAIEPEPVAEVVDIAGVGSMTTW